MENNGIELTKKQVECIRAMIRRDREMGSNIPKMMGLGKYKRDNNNADN